MDQTEQYGLQQIVEELKNKGLAAGREEAARIVAKAEAEAAKILADARAKADLVTRQAAQEKTRTLATLETEMSHAAVVGLAAFRQAVENSFVIPELDDTLEHALSRPEFLENVILEMIKGFIQSGLYHDDLEVVLPDSRKAQLESAFFARLRNKAAEGVKISFDNTLSWGCKIGFKAGGFHIDLSDEGFKELFSRFISPRFRKAFYVNPNKVSGQHKVVAASTGGGRVAMQERK